MQYDETHVYVQLRLEKCGEVWIRNPYILQILVSCIASYEEYHHGKSAESYICHIEVT